MEGEFRRIGQGFCGTVWAAPIKSGCSFAHKREDGGPDRSLHNDFLMHSRIQKTVPFWHSQIQVPVCHRFVDSGDRSWWDYHISRFPTDHQVPCNILITERIPPFSKVVRDNITDIYCPESLRSSIKLSEPDQDCLIRPYLGRRRRRVTKQSKFQAFSLRNYPLHVDQMEELALDSVLYARIMAETLANLYWSAQIDANDVEFVLARPKVDYAIPTGPVATSHPITNSQILGNHAVWLLDFDCCKPMSLDEAGVEQAVVAFYRNDPFYPRPGRNDVRDQRLWNEFKQRFLEESEAILGPGNVQAHLPTRWVELVEQKGQAVNTDN